MSKRGAKVIHQSLNDDSMSSLFQQLLGTDKPDPDIIVPKYNKVIDTTRRIVRLLEAFDNSKLHDVYDGMAKHSEEIADFCRMLKLLEHVPEPESSPSSSTTAPEQDADTGADTGADTDTAPTDDGKSEGKQPQPTPEQVVDLYLSIKDSQPIRELIDTCKTLIQSKTAIMAEPIDVGFVDRIPGVTYHPLTFTTLNFKVLWASPKTTPELRNYIATVLKVMYTKTYDIYKQVTSADVDVNKFSELIMTSITKVRKMIPRCDDAFDRIAKSVDLLKGNFDGYYRDFVQTQNPLTLVTNFVYDVAKQDGVDSKVTFQFRKIMSFYQKHTQGKIKDPRVKKVFELLSSNMSILENENVTEIKRMEAEDAVAQAKSDAADEANEAGGGATSQHETMSKSKKKRLKQRAKKIAAAAATTASAATSTDTATGDGDGQDDTTTQSDACNNDVDEQPELANGDPSPQPAVGDVSVDEVEIAD